MQTFYSFCGGLNWSKYELVKVHIGKESVPSCQPNSCCMKWMLN